MAAPFVFVLMPFHNSFDDIYKYGIKKTCEDLGCYCERVDEQQYEERMLDRIYNQINKADIIIADLSEKNPNVFYETGYAHALQKRVILLTKDGSDIPFDLKQHYHIVYSGSISSLSTQLSRKLSWYINNPSTVPIPNINELEYLVNGAPAIDGMVLELPLSELKTSYRYYINLRVGIHNPNSHLISIKHSVGVFYDKKLDVNEATGFKSIEVGSNTFLHVSEKDTLELLPNMWELITFPLEVKSKFAWREEVKLVIFSELNTKELTVTLNFEGVLRVKYPQSPPSL
jgi:hypothetical protein